MKINVRETRSQVTDGKQAETDVSSFLLNDIIRELTQWAVNSKNFKLASKNDGDSKQVQH